MSHQVTARKWRPKNFESMVGQEHVLEALAHALQHQKLRQAYLFTGTRGVGKTTVARILAKCLNCETGITSTPCGQCEACQSIDQGCFVDLIEVDAASRTKVEDTRELLDNVQYVPTQGRFKIYLIDEVHMLSGHSFNALLKTLEEPPEHVVFLLATTDPQKLPMTVLSRCLQFHLKHLSPEEIAQQLQHILKTEAVSFESEATDLLAVAAKGSMRDAQSLMDQAVAFGGGSLQAQSVRDMLGTIDPKIVQTVLTALSAKKGEDLLKAADAVAEQTGDFNQALAALIQALHEIAVLQTVESKTLKSSPRFSSIASFVDQFSPEDIQLFYQIALQGRRDLPWAASERSGFEMTLLRMLAFQPVETRTVVTEQPQDKVEEVIEEIEEEIEEVEETAFHAKMEMPFMTEEEERIVEKAEETPASIDWSSLLPQLKLTDMAAMLASHCVVKEFINGVLVCALSPKHAPLYHKHVADRIATALTNHLKQPIKLDIKIQELSQETPAQQQAVVQSTALNEARSHLREDATVKALEQAFDARLDEGSVKTHT